jgi:hypothetical protein
MEYVESEIAGLERELLTSEPLYKDLEKESVDDLIESTRLLDVDYRRFLFDNLDEVEKSDDKMILLAKALDPISRGIRKQMEECLESIQKESYAEIAKIRFEKFQDTIYPDATFTLRLSIGAMRGYQDGPSYIKPFTLLGGAFEHSRKHGCKDPYRLPDRWIEREKSLNKGVPFNFISTNDIIGGNSGSPVINAKGEFVGIIFDGNEHSLIWNYEFSDIKGRAVSVHSSGILECLDKIYNAQALVEEILFQEI